MADVSVEEEFIGGRFHIKKNQLTGFFDVTAIRKHIVAVTTDKRTYNKTYDFEAVVCRHKTVLGAMDCAQGIDCVHGIPVGRLS